MPCAWTEAKNPNSWKEWMKKKLTLLKKPKAEVQQSRTFSPQSWHCAEVRVAGCTLGYVPEEGPGRIQEALCV